MVKVGIISWNIGKDAFNEEKLTELFRKYYAKNKDDADVLIVGFQEVSKHIFENKHDLWKKSSQMIEDAINKITNNYILNSIYKDKMENVNLFTCLEIPSGFGISMYILRKENAIVDIVKVIRPCQPLVKPKKKDFTEHALGTKGMVAATLEISKNGDLANKITIDIINTHMPFKDVSTTIKFIDKIKEIMEKNNFKSSKQIIFGDLNSRSILMLNQNKGKKNGDCYMKDTNNCKNFDITKDINFNDISSSFMDKGESLYCIIKKKLENLNFNDTIQKYTDYEKKSDGESVIMKEELTINNETKLINNCNLFNRINKDKINSLDKINKMKLDEIVKMLTESDILRKNLNWFDYKDKKFKEHDFPYLPTYKRDTKTGKFKLTKHDKGRLPGYADKIIYASDKNVNVENYMPLDITGNDHLPICALLDFNTKTSGGKSKRKYKAKKKQKTKKNKKMKKTKKTRKN